MGLAVSFAAAVLSAPVAAQDAREDQFDAEMARVRDVISKIVTAQCTGGDSVQYAKWGASSDTDVFPQTCRDEKGVKDISVTLNPRKEFLFSSGMAYTITEVNFQSGATETHKDIMELDKDEDRWEHMGGTLL